MDKQTLRTHPSLLSLRMALIAAESETPACPPRVDRNEQLAMLLIERMQREFKKSFSFTASSDIAPFDTVRLQEAIPSHA
jgi:hypothetical protein